MIDIFMCVLGWVMGQQHGVQQSLADLKEKRQIFKNV